MFKILQGLSLALLNASLAMAQMTITGTISGTIMDPSRQVVPGIPVALVSGLTGETRSATTNELGGFTFTAVSPGSYSMKVEAPGFKSFRQTNLVLSANERLSLGDVLLSIGAVTDTITVEAQGATVQASSSERSASLTSEQLTSLQARGRDVNSLFRLLPGVQYAADGDSVGGSFGTGSSNMGGTTSGMNTLSVDGVVSNDNGSPNVFSSVTTMDAIGEVKVILNSYQAEYAGNGGAVVQVVTKSGGKEYHGTGYWYKRHEMWNANDFFSNRNSVQRPIYRYNTLGFTLGGPIYIPGKWNTSKDKLFGFYNLEQWGIKYPGSLQRVTTPTALERAGDFSQTLDVSGKLIPIKDPTTGLQFPNNIIPASRINKNGVALMNLEPLPNFFDRSISGGNYNYKFQELLNNPKRSQLFKFDYVPTSADRLFVRGKTWLSEQEGHSVAGGASAWGLFAQCYCFTESGLGVGYTHVFSPTVVNELTSGVRHNHEAWHPVDPISRVLRSSIGFTAGQYYPSANVQGIIPRFSFGGVPSSADATFDDRFLTGGTDFTFTLSDNVSITKGTHLFKVGFDYNRIREYEGERSTFSGNFAFARDTNNPNDSNYAYSNAVLGNFQQYTESTNRFGANERQTFVEWFVQDSWKVRRNLTIDYGMRFSWSNQMYPHKDGEQSVLALGRYNIKDAPIFFAPGFDANRNRVAIDPRNGTVYPVAYIGAFVPNTGKPANGSVLSGDANYAHGFVNNQPLLYGPRIGFSWDPFGKGKTAIRGGSAILYNMRLSKWSPTTNNPPAIFSPTTYYGNLATFTQAANVLSPSNTNAFNVDNKTTSTYNITFGIQQELGHSFLADVSYGATLGRHIQQGYNINTVPYGANFNTANLDPTNGRPLPVNFFRPYPGYGNINFIDNAFGSNYHALLTSLNRRFSRGLQMGVSYTYSKFMDYSGIPVYRPIRVWSYGKNGGDQTHNFVANFTYDLPKVSNYAKNAVVHHVLDGWQLTGIVALVSGQPSGVGYSTTDGADITGGGDGSRIVVTGPAQLDHGSKTFLRWFDTSKFARPQVGYPGNAPKDIIRGPGFSNVDVSFVKKIPLKNERQFFALRWEMYNALNHTQFSGVDTTARFDPAGAQVNATFGQVTSTRAPRIMQASLRFTF